MTFPVLRTAKVDDRVAVERLLLNSGLPIEGIDELFATHADDIIVADDPVHAGELAAVAALEACCDNALLRSVAVHPEWRAHGLGEQLVRRAVGHAEERGLRALYLLTMTAEYFFPRFGFERIERDSVPPEIAATLEFRSTCPSTAVAMSKSLAASSQ